MRRFAYATIAGVLALIVPIGEDWLVFQRGGRYHAPEADFEREEVWLRTDDGVRLHAWFCCCPPQLAAPERERLTVVYFHGSFGELTWRQWVARRWHECLGADVLLFDYRGYGLSAGQPSEEGLYLDARAAHQWVTDVRKLDPNRVVLVGRSLGGAVALELALEVRPRAVVLENTFTDVRDVAQEHCLGLPVGLVMHNHFPTLERIKQLGQPVFLAHGDNDRVIPVDHSRRLYCAANSPKHLLVLPGQGHLDFPPDEYYIALREFLRANP
jgi:pimeloyl-ACP methyl ester carboxylesterase